MRNTKNNIRISEFRKDSTLDFGHRDSVGSSSYKMSATLGSNFQGLKKINPGSNRLMPRGVSKDSGLEGPHGNSILTKDSDFPSIMKKKSVPASGAMTQRVTSKQAIPKGRMTKYNRVNMLSSSIPDFQESNRGLNSKFDTIDKDMLLNREVSRLIENLKQGKTNDSDLNQRLNLKPKGGKGGKAKQQHFTRAATKPKLKKAISVVNGSVSYLISGGNKKLSMLKDKDDFDDELFSFKKKELDHNFQFGFSESPHGQDFGKNSLTKVILTKEEKKKIATGADNKLRLRTVQYLVETNEQVIHKLKLNYKILANWLNYVGYLSRLEFESALKSIGIRYDKRLYEKLFWLFDMNGDGIIDEKEFVLINDLFKGHTVEEKAKIFFALCDQENEGFLDEPKLKIFFKKKVLTEDWRLEDSKNDAHKQTQ